ncbi:hypothetical protein [Bradyrhizobium sp.]
MSGSCGSRLLAERDRTTPRVAGRTLHRVRDTCICCAYRREVGSG